MQKATITTPTMIWSAPYRSAKNASRDPKMPPATAPASMPSQRSPEALPIIAPRNAPARNWPSMAMLMTPDRSHRRPDIEPYTSGVVAINVSASMSTKLRDSPRDTHVRKDQMKRTTPSVKIRYVPRLRCRNTSRSPSAAQRTPSTIEIQWTDMTSGATATAGGAVRMNVACTCAGTARPNSQNMRIASMTRKMPMPPPARRQ